MEVAKQSVECKKVKYANQEYALEAIKKIKRTSKRETQPRRAYFCENCSCWHLTSQQSDNAYVDGVLRARNNHIKKLEDTILIRNKEITRLNNKIPEVKSEYQERIFVLNKKVAHLERQLLDNLKKYGAKNN